MSIEVKIVKDIPKDQITKYEDRVVYFSAVLTREYTKGANAYPELTGELRQQEIKAPITGSHGQYNLLWGVDYAPYVWNMKNVNWTNKNTKPQWYETIFKQKEKTITDTAMQRAGGELK